MSPKKNLDETVGRNQAYVNKRKAEADDPKTVKKVRAAKKRLKRAQRTQRKLEMVKSGKFKKKKRD